MSVSVGQRVQSMIDHMSKGEIELALSDICIAIDITSQKYYNEPNSSASCYKRFLKENIWMIVVTGMGSLITEAVKLPFTHNGLSFRSPDSSNCAILRDGYVMLCVAV